MSVTAIIPARMASSRFPGKPIGRICGLPMIEHVWQRVRLCDAVDDVVIATCDREIADVAARFGGKVVMTSPSHESCLDRIAEAAQNMDADIIVNVQGDMPLIHPGAIKDLVKPFFDEEEISFTDMMGLITEPSEIDNPNVVKVVVDRSGNALYYSREPIPSSKKAAPGTPVKVYKQFGINAFRRDALMTYTKLTRTGLEAIESVDMLRLLENGYKVRMVDTPHPVVGVDTPEDMARAEELMKEDFISRNYLHSLS